MTLLITPPHYWQDKEAANSSFDFGWKRDGIGNVGKPAFTNSLTTGGECCLLCAARENPSQWTTLLSRESSFDTVRVIIQLVQAAKAGDADACSMALRALSWLPAGQRATIAMLALASLDEDDAAHVVEATLRTAGFPLSDLVAPMAAARQWAEWASRAERTAYAAACFEALSADDRAAFLRRYTRRVPASVRDRDARPGPGQESASTYGIKARQIPYSRSDPCAENVNPARADLTNENPGTTAIATKAKDVMTCVCPYNEYIAAFPNLEMHWGALV